MFIILVAPAFCGYSCKSPETSGANKNNIKTKTASDISINTSPAGADVYFDGKPAGKSPVEVKNVNDGVHKVRVLKDGYKEKNAEVEVNSAGIKVFFFRLKSAGPESG